MSNLENMTTGADPRPDMRIAFANVVPLTPGEQAAVSSRWDRRGLLQRLVRVN